MTAVDVFDEARAAGVRLSVNGAKLHCDGALTPELRARLVECKHQLLTMLRMRDRMLALGAEIGVERYVEKLPGCELEAWTRDLATVGDEDLQRAVLMLFLHDLVDGAWPPVKAKPIDDGRRPGEFHDWRDGLTTNELQHIRGDRHD